MTEGLAIQLLGDFRESVGPRMIAEREWKVRKVKSLVKVLALAPHHRLHRELVIDRWWPDMGSEDEANNLHKVFYVPLCRALAAEARRLLQRWERMHLQIARKYTPGGSLGVSLLTTQIEGGAE